MACFMVFDFELMLSPDALHLPNVAKMNGLQWIPLHVPHLRLAHHPYRIVDTLLNLAVAEFFSYIVIDRQALQQQTMHAVYFTFA